MTHALWTVKQVAYVCETMRVVVLLWQHFENGMNARHNMRGYYHTGVGLLQHINATCQCKICTTHTQHRATSDHEHTNHATVCFVWEAQACRNFIGGWTAGVEPQPVTDMEWYENMKEYGRHVVWIIASQQKCCPSQMDRAPPTCRWIAPRPTSRRVWLLQMFPN